MELIVLEFLNPCLDCSRFILDSSLNSLVLANSSLWVLPCSKHQLFSFLVLPQASSMLTFVADIETFYIWTFFSFEQQICSVEIPGIYLFKQCFHPHDLYLDVAS